MIFLKLQGICQSTVLNEELSNHNFTTDSKRNPDYFIKTPKCKPTFHISKNKMEEIFFFNNVLFLKFSNQSART